VYPTGSGPQPAVGICGSYGGLNLGDEAILTAALHQLRQAIPGVELTVFSREVEHTRAYHDVDRVVDARGALRDELVAEVERLDLLLLGGGGLLYDREAEVYLHLPRIAQAVGVRTATYAIGAGPLGDLGERRAVADCLNGMAAITVRDAPARRLLEEIGVEREIVVTADPALLLEPSPIAADELQREGIVPGRKLVGLSVREPGAAGEALDSTAYHVLLAYAADFVADRFDADLLFIPMERQDVRHAHRVISEMDLPDRATVLKGNYGPRELLALMSRLDFAVGMRLHFIVLAALAGVPALGLPYAAKVTALLERLGLPAPRLIGREHAGPLLAAIDRSWDSRSEQASVLRARLPPLQDDARRTARLIATLLPTPLGDAAARTP
jgi:polysaccharide pyruvyl transferase CsaB